MQIIRERQDFGKSQPGGMGSAAALVIYNGKILMQHRDNIPQISQPGKWGLPGGRIEKGENFDQALIRELDEEISVCPKNYFFIGLLPLKDNADHAIYLVRLTSEEAKKVKLGNEGSEIKWFTLKQLLTMDLVDPLKECLIEYQKEISKILFK